MPHELLKKKSKAVAAGFFRICRQMMETGRTCLSHREELIISKGSEKIENAPVLPREPRGKKMNAIFMNARGPVVQVPCPSGHAATGRFYRNSALKK